MNRPFVNGNREQTNNFIVDGFDVNETHRQPRRLPAESRRAGRDRVETNNYSADTGNVGGAVVGNVIKSGSNRLPRQRLRVLPQQRLRREHLGEQPLRRAQAGAAAGHLRRHPRRPDRPATGCSSSPTTRARGRTRPGFGTASVAPEAWRRGDLSSIAAVIRDPQTDLPFPGNQIPADRISPIAPRAARRHARTTRCPTAACRAASPATTSARRCSRSAATRATCRVDWNASASDKFFARYSFATYEDAARRQPVPARLRRPATTSRSGTSAATGTASSAPTMVNELLVGFSHTTRRLRDLRLVGHRRRATRATASPAASRSTGSARARLRGSGLTAPGAIAPDSDTLAKTFQINEKLTWLHGPPHLQVRRAVAALRPAALLRRQQRPARLHHLQRRVHRQLRSPTSCSTWSSGKGRGGGDPDDPWTHLQNRIGAVRAGRLQAARRT